MAQLEGQTLMIEPKYGGHPASMPEAQAEISKNLQTSRAQYDGVGRSIRENNCVTNMTSAGTSSRDARGSVSMRFHHAKFTSDFPEYYNAPHPTPIRAKRVSCRAERPRHAQPRRAIEDRLFFAFWDVRDSVVPMHPAVT